MRRRILAFVLVFCLLALTACSCKHEWQEATCTSPRTCIRCEETEGEPLGHSYAEATCTEPRMCTKCGETDGEPLGHSWIDATCTRPKYCSVCNLSEGTVGEHVAGSWENSSDAADVDYVHASQKRVKRCINCAEILDEDSVSIETLHNGEYFLFTIEEFRSRLNYIYSRNSTFKGYKAYVYETTENAAVYVEKDGSLCFLILFYQSGGSDMITTTDTANISDIILTIDEEKYNDAVMGTIGITMACDPTIDLMEALDMMINLLQDIVNGQKTSDVVNGIRYGAAGTPKPSSSRKYVCPCCGMSVRATKAVNIACLDCDEQMVLAE